MIGTEDGRSFRSSENPTYHGGVCAARLFQRSVMDAKFALKMNKIRLLAIVPADTVPHRRSSTIETGEFTRREVRCTYCRTASGKRFLTLLYQKLEELEA